MGRTSCRMANEREKSVLTVTTVEMTRLGRFSGLSYRFDWWALEDLNL